MVVDPAFVPSGYVCPDATGRERAGRHPSLHHQPKQPVGQRRGDFNNWDTQSHPLQKKEEGIWTTTIKLKPGRYEYMFVVNGQEWKTDPRAALIDPMDLEG